MENLITKKPTVLEAALSYKAKGWSTIPQQVTPGKNMKGDKKPLVTWGDFRYRMPSEDEIRNWYSTFPYAGVAIVTGKLSKLVVLDVDIGGDHSKFGELPRTVCTKTPSGGRHYYFLYPEGLDIKSSDSKIGPHLDIKAEDGLITAPPTHYSGNVFYEWINSPEDIEIAAIPESLLAAILNVEQQRSLPKKEHHWEKLLQGVDVGSRNESATELSGKLLQILPSEFWEIGGWTTLKEWNLKANLKPLTEKELRSTWESIKRKETNKRVMGEQKTPPKSQAQSDLLLNAVNRAENKVTFFHNELKDPYVRVFINDHYEIWSCKSKNFKRWLAKIYWETYKKAPSSEVIKSGINIIEGRACFDGSQISLFNRVAFSDNTIWYDLADSKWRAIKITEKGWSIENEPPIIFRRYAHQQAQVDPTKNGDLKLLLKYVNIPDSQNQLLLLVWLVSCFIPDFPHPVLTIYGPQGSAKSVSSKIFKKVTDPSSIEVTSFPKDLKELVQILSHHWCLFFDNLSDLPAAVSDMLCKAVTGDGFSKRELFSDDDDIIYNFKRCLGINGINLVSERADLMERSILLELERVSQENRKQESTLFAEFDLDKPLILGGIFDTLVKALQLKPLINPDDLLLPRMADFTVWGCAIAEVLGFTQESFLSAYRANLKSQNTAIIYEDCLASAVCAFMGDKPEWSGLHSELINLLSDVARGQGINVDKDPQWPKKPNVLSRRLKTLKTNLEVEGVYLTKLTDSRTIRIHKKLENIANIVDTDTQASREDP
jgi:hypothetical protein